MSGVSNTVVAGKQRLVSGSNPLGSNLADLVFKYLTALCAAGVLLLVVLMGYEMYRGAEVAIEKFGWTFFAESNWDPVLEEYGALPFVFGTIVSSFLALVISLPLSIGVAVFLSEIAPAWFERPLSWGG